jgi:hypothetical protein
MQILLFQSQKKNTKQAKKPKSIKKKISIQKIKKTENQKQKLKMQ